MRFRLPICLLLLGLFFPLTLEAVSVSIAIDPGVRVVILSQNTVYIFNNPKLLVCNKSGIDELYNIRKKQYSIKGAYSQSDGIPSEGNCIFLEKGSKAVFLEELKKYSLPVESLYKVGGNAPCPFRLYEYEYCTYLGEFPDWRYFKVQYLWKEKDDEEGKWYEGYAELWGQFILEDPSEDPPEEKDGIPDAVSQELTTGEARSAAASSAEQAETCPSAPAFLPAEKQE